MIDARTLAGRLGAAGLALREGRPRIALDAFEAILADTAEDNPSHEEPRIEALIGSGTALRRLGAPDAAARQFEKAATGSPDRADVRLMLSAALLDAERPVAAEAALGALPSSIRPSRDDTARLFYDLAGAQRGLGRLAAAEEMVRRSIDVAPIAASYLTLSDVLVDRYRIEDAIAACEDAARLRPESSNVRYRLGIRLLEGGRLEEARDAFVEAIRLDPANASAHYSLARIGGGPESRARSGWVDQLRALAENPKATLRQRTDADFALFEILDRLDDRDSAFHHLARANARVRGSFRYSSQGDAAYFERIIDLFSSPPDPDRTGGAGPLGTGHIFVVGLPRSGTTLVEQILSSHPLVHGAGEIQTFRMEVLRGVERAGAETGYPDGAASLSPTDWAGIGRAYDTEVDRAGRAIAVNKMPGNFGLLPAIRAALPGARIVHCLRDPLDNAFSIYRHNFVGWGFHYAYDQVELGRFLGTKDRFMAHWREREPGVILDLVYEDLVSDTETVVRRLLAHCGLDWDQACLDPSANRRIVRTASVEQVRRPISNTSIGVGRRYADHLRPLRRALAQEGFEAS